MEIIIKDLIKAYNIPALEVPGFEADDVIGTMAKKAEWWPSKKGLRLGKNIVWSWKK